MELWAVQETNFDMGMVLADNKTKAIVNYAHYNGLKVDDIEFATDLQTPNWVDKTPVLVLGMEFPSIKECPISGIIDWDKEETTKWRLIPYPRNQ